MEIFKNKISEFKSPGALPETDEQARFWQEENRKWWENNPMRYDWSDKIKFKEFSKEFFEEIDRRFFSNSKEYFSFREKPFDALIDFKSLSQKDVLEIGVGNGSHAQLLAGSAKSFTGIDITDYAVGSVKKRLEAFNLPGQIIKMDAEALAFKDNSFDFVWSWGVIHHSSNTEKIIKEIKRVLRPNGEAIIMVYYKGWWNYYLSGILRGIISGKLFKTKSLHKTVQFLTDGAIARYYSIADWLLMVKDLFKIEYFGIFGPKSDSLPFISKLLPDNFGRILTHNLRMGSFLVCRLKKTEI